ncbi:cation transporter [Alkalicoccus halolimnae]|uniref:Cation transporter n=1 Tax=Alkalicoccus halolimnae TaxID=1667239 RepID=A0A5C7F9A6_9BACI|nr:cation transporter [Alkalicoccus halolimnae]TXF87291.1 heavy-metal-associated domain-containing protein [Alkalicoccus halolimnae]
MQKEVIQVAGMTCGHCKQAVEGAASSVKGVSRAEVDLKAGNVTVEMEEGTNITEIKEEIEDQGYDIN